MPIIAESQIVAVVPKQKYSTKLRTFVYDILRTARSNQAVVFDIDDTLLHMAPRSSSCGAVHNAPMRLVYNLCMTEKIPVFIVTARPDTPYNRKWTEDQLKCLRYTRYKALFMRPPRITSWAGIAKFKHDSRAAIRTKYKYRVLLNVGDQWSDVFAKISPCMSKKLDEQFTNNLVLFAPSDYQNTTWALKLPSVIKK